MGEKAVGEKHTWVPNLWMKHIWVKGLLVWKKNKTYVGNNQLGATHMGEKSVCEKNCG